MKIYSHYDKLLEEDVYVADDVQLAVWNDKVDRNDPKLPIKERGGWSATDEGVFWYDCNTKKTWGPYKDSDELVLAVEKEMK